MRSFISAVAASVLVATPALATDFTFSSPILLPGGQPVLTLGPASPFAASFSVSGMGAISDVNLTLNNFMHSFMDDLHFILRAPSGTAVYLMANAGGTDGSPTQPPVTFTFDQQAAAPYANGTGTGQIVGGSYQPSLYGSIPALLTSSLPFSISLANNSLDAFNGQNPNGTWRFYAFDDAGADVGSIGSLTLSIQDASGTVPEPSTWASMMIGLGLVGAAMRRRAKIAFA